MAAPTLEARAHSGPSYTTLLDFTDAQATSNRPLPAQDAEVRGQRERYNPATWVRHWQVTGKPLPPSLTPTATTQTVTRQELFDQARDLSSDERVLDLYVRMCGWGAGTAGRSIVRCAKPLAASQLAAKLTEAHRIAIADGAVEAYRYMLRPHAGWVRDLGPAYITKWLYFTTYDSWALDTPAPLILDKNVAKGLGLRLMGGWPPSEYRAYLETVNALCTHYDRSTSHCIEHALFTVGRTLP